MWTVPSKKVTALSLSLVFFPITNQKMSADDIVSVFVRMTQSLSLDVLLDVSEKMTNVMDSLHCKMARDLKFFEKMNVTITRQVMVKVEGIMEIFYIKKDRYKYLVKLKALCPEMTEWITEGECRNSRLIADVLTNDAYFLGCLLLQEPDKIHEFYFSQKDEVQSLKDKLLL